MARFCPRCRAAVEESHRFCSSCGWNLAAPIAAPTSRNFDTHVKVLAVLLMVTGVLALGGGLFMLLATGFALTVINQAIGHMFPAGLLAPVVLSVPWFLIAFAAAKMAAGLGLLDYAPWARSLAVAVLVLGLLNLPFGTALGIYGLWVLLSASGQEHYRQATARG
jgi:hypothetical protein